MVSREPDGTGSRTTFHVEVPVGLSWETTMALHLSVPPTDSDLRELGRAILIATST